MALRATTAGVGFIGLCGLISGSSIARLHSQHATGPVAAHESFSAASSHLPIGFEPNRGQFLSRSAFGSHGLGYALSIDPAGASLRFRRSATDVEAASLTLRLVGANEHAAMRGADLLPGIANYFSGSRAHWITAVPTYERVTVEDVYPGVDVSYHGNDHQLEYDFIVKPHASADVIKVEFSSASAVAIDPTGDLAITIGETTVHQLAPRIYQTVGDRRVAVRGGYMLTGRHRVGFRVQSYDRSIPLVIDPQIGFSIYGPGMSRSYGIGVDPQGNVYLAGTGPDAFFEGNTNAFVAKINAAGTAVLWTSGMGSGNYNDSATAIAVDAAGNAYVTGWTEYMPSGPSFPHFPTVNPIQADPSGPSDAFVTKFDTNGTMVYSTLLGGSGVDRGDGIAVDASGRIYVTGQTTSADFPTASPLQSSIHGTSDAFVSVLNPQGSAFVYSTYVGGSGADAGDGIAVDSRGNAYVTGFTTSADFPTVAPVRAAEAGGKDAFILKLNPAGSALVYSTYLGGSGNDTPTGIAVDSSGAAYVSGATNSTDFPVVSAVQSTLHGGFDAFVTKVNAAGTAFAYSTYLGGANDDTTGGSWCEEKPTCGGIAVNGAGNAYITGTTASSDFPQVRSTQPYRGVTDAFVAQLSVDGASLLYSTLIGGATADANGAGAFSSGAAIVYLNGTAYLAGLTNTTDFPITSNPTKGPCCVNNAWNGIDGFVTTLVDDPNQGQSPWTRVEQDSAAIQYAGTWYTNASAGESGGSANLTPSGSATFTFSGTGARWIGLSDPWSGIANVYVDGGLAGTVDAYAGAGQYQAVEFTVTGLASGGHTLKVEATGQHNPAGSEPWIWVDAFEYMAGGAGGGGNGDFSISITPRALVANQGGTTTATVSVTGTSGFSGVVALSLSGLGSAGSGSFNPVSVTGSGSSTLTISMASSATPGGYSVTVNGVSGSLSRSATVPLQVNPASQTGWVRLEEWNGAVSYTGDWYNNSNSNESGGTAKLSPDGAATLTFSGTGARWIGYGDPWSGIASVYVDGVLVTSVDTYSASTRYQAVQFAVTGLSSGSHTLTVQATGQQNAAAQAAWIWVDAFEYTTDQIASSEVRPKRER